MKVKIVSPNIIKFNQLKRNLLTNISDFGQSKGLT